MKAGAAAARHVDALRCFHAGVLWLALALFAPPALAASWQDEVPDGRLIGQGEMRWLGLSLYTAQLWSSDPRIGERVPFALVLTYRRSISREQLVDASIKEIQRVSETPPDATRLARWRGYMNTAFRDVVEGDQLIGVYLPGKGCRFYHRNDVVAQIDDPEFARVFFAIWLAPQARDPALRRRLLGGAS